MKPMIKRMFFLAGMWLMAAHAGAQAYRSMMYVDPKEKLCEDYCSPLFRSADGTVITIADKTIGGYTNILDWLDGRVAGLQVIVTRDRVRIPIIRGSVATVFLDEVRVDPDVLNSISVFDIALVKVFKTPFVGSPGANSAIAVYTL